MIVGSRCGANDGDKRTEVDKVMVDLEAILSSTCCAAIHAVAFSRNNRNK